MALYIYIAPSNWGHAYIRPRKEANLTPKSYCPVSLTPIVCADVAKSLNKVNSQYSLMIKKS